jgi:hypothetical protein
MATKRSSARHHPIRCDGRSNTAPKRLRANRSGGSNGPDLDYDNIGPRLRGRFRLSPVGYGGGIGIGGIPLIVLISRRHPRGLDLDKAAIFLDRAQVVTDLAGVGATPWSSSSMRPVCPKMVTEPLSC